MSRNCSSTTLSSRWGWLLAFPLALASTPADAFKNNQHDAASTLAVDNAGTVAPDIKKFKPLIVGWSFGINYSILGVSGFFGKPAEQLAHVGDQTRDIGSVLNNNGNFLEFLDRLDAQYAVKNFSSEEHLKEGAYVLMGTSLHLIEDQASFPHGANVLHQAADKWEGPLFPQRVEVGFTGTQGVVPPDEAYQRSLLATQAKIPGIIPPSPMSPTYNQYWVMNDQLRAGGDTSKSATRYGGQYTGTEGVDPPFTGAYGGASGEDIFSHDLEPGRYFEQGTQATDFAFNFLLRVSKSLPPISSDLVIAAPTVNGQTIINTTDGSPVKFRVTENRTQQVDVRVFVQETGQSIVAESAVRRLAPEKSASGTLQETAIPGPMTWNNLRTALDATKDSNLTLLPFESDFDLVWKGKVDGAPLADGQYNLCVVSRDLDVLSSPGPAEGRSDTCVSFAIPSPDFSTRIA